MRCAWCWSSLLDPGGLSFSADLFRVNGEFVYVCYGWCRNPMLARSPEGESHDHTNN